MTRSLIHYTPFRRPLMGAFGPIFGKAMIDDFIRKGDPEGDARARARENLGGTRDSAVSAA